MLMLDVLKHCSTMEFLHRFFKGCSVVNRLEIKELFNTYACVVNTTPLANQCIKREACIKREYCSSRGFETVFAIKNRVIVYCENRCATYSVCKSRRDAGVAIVWNCYIEIYELL